MPDSRKVAYVIYKLPPGLTGAGLRILKYLHSVPAKNSISFILTRYNQVVEFIEYQKRTGMFKFDKKVFKEITDLSGSHINKGILKPVNYFVNLTFVFFQVLPFLLINRKKYTIIHCLGWNFIVYSSILISKMMGKKIVVEVTMLGEPPVDRKNSSLWKRLLNKNERLVYKLASKYIVLSMALYDELIAMGISSEKIEVIENPVNTKMFYDVDKGLITGIRNKLQIPSGSPVFIFVGALIYRKGVDIFPELFARLSQTYPDGIFLILGENDLTEEERNYKNKIQQAIKNEKVLFYGMVENVVDYLNVSNYFIFPSRREGLPNAVLEAMASGLPVLMNNIPGISDFIIEHGQNGFIIDNNEISKYIELIDKLQSNNEFYLQISNNAKKAVINRFSIENRNSKLDKLYVQLSA